MFLGELRRQQKLSEIEKVNKKVNSTVRFLCNPEGKCVKSTRGQKHILSDTWRLLPMEELFRQHTVLSLQKCSDRRETEKSTGRNECRKLKNANSFFARRTEKEKCMWFNATAFYSSTLWRNWRLTSCLYEAMVGPAALVAEVFECT